MVSASFPEGVKHMRGTTPTFPSFSCHRTSFFRRPIGYQFKAVLLGLAS